MTDNKNTILQSAMRYGFPLGLFWIFKYPFLIFGSSSTFISSIYMFLTTLTVVIAYYATIKYKKDLGGNISFFRAWGFGIFLYFFAAILVAIPHYIHYEYISPTYIAESLEQTKGILENLNSQTYLTQLEEMGIPTSIRMTFYDIFSNLFSGVIFSLPVAVIACIGRLPGPDAVNNKTEE